MPSSVCNCLSGSVRSFSLFAVLVVVALTGGCAQTRSAGPEVTLKPHEGPLSVLLMPVDVELSLLTTGGMLEPNAAWTEQGRQNIVTALKEELAERGIVISTYGDDGAPSDEIASAHVQLVKLHEAVGGAIRIHSYTPGLALPTKKDRFDWTLGEGVQALRKSDGGDYALFVYARDSFSSGGRVALKFALALLSAHIQGGQQLAFASLVDLDSGAIVWFNVLHSGVGDLRDPKLARQAIDSLLDSSPL